MRLLTAAWLSAVGVVLLAPAGRAAPTQQGPTQQGPAQRGPAQRIVSMIPAVTEMLFAIGDGPRVVGVTSYDQYPAEVARLVRVGGLLDPDVERILSLRPDLVVVYNTQVELKQRLDRAGIEYFSYEHRALPDITTTVRAIGARIGSAERANAAAAGMESAIAAIRKAVAGSPRPRTLLVFERDRSSLRNIYASGGYGFLHDMLEAAGGVNVFADVKRQAVDVSTEMLLARKPDVVIELWYGDLGKNLDLARQTQAWNALGAVPAVRNHRIYELSGDEFVVPGPRVVAATRRLAEALHPGILK
ncbi:MAG: helical backbone metal receptor [Acidobacteriota bacterium]